MNSTASAKTPVLPIHKITPAKKNKLLENKLSKVHLDDVFSTSMQLPFRNRSVKAQDKYTIVKKSHHPNEEEKRRKLSPYLAMKSHILNALGSETQSSMIMDSKDFLAVMSKN